MIHKAIRTLALVGVAALVPSTVSATDSPELPVPQSNHLNSDADSRLRDILALDVVVWACLLGVGERVGVIGGRRQRSNHEQVEGGKSGDSREGSE